MTQIKTHAKNQREKKTLVCKIFITLTCFNCSLCLYTCVCLYRVSGSFLIVMQVICSLFAIMITWQAASRSNGCMTSQDLHTRGDSFLKTRCPKNWKRREDVGINKTYLSKHTVPSSILSASGQLGLDPLQYVSFLQDVGSSSRHLMETLLYTQLIQQGESYPSLRRETR